MLTKLSERIQKALQLDNFPVAISFASVAPEGIEKMKGKVRLCQMLDKVRYDGESFYTDSECHECDGGASSCGLRMMSENRKTGGFLVKMGLFGSERAARRFLSANPKIESGTVKVVAFSPLEKTTFEPDVVVIICNARQGMKITEAYAYGSGKRTTGLTGPPICSSVVAAPFLTGEVVYSLGDVGARKYMKIDDGDVFIGIPVEHLPDIIDSLENGTFE